MEFEIKGKVVPSLEVSLSNGESMFTQSGGMFWQTEGIKMETNTKGGIFKGIGRVLAAQSSVELRTTFNKKLGTGFFGGEGLFLTKLTGPGKVVLQTMNMNEFAHRISCYIPTNSN